MLTEEFKGVRLGDERLNQRCQKVAKTIGRHPDKSIPQACVDWSDTKGAYRFFSNEEVSRQAILQPHIERTVKRCHPVEVLAIQDTTYLNFTHHPSVRGLGPIGTVAGTAEGLSGLIVHSTLAVNADKGQVIGLLHQEVWVRKGHAPKEETDRQRRKRKRESQCWTRGVQVLHRQGLGHAIHMTDREGDIYELMESLDRNNQRFIIRASKNRRLDQEKTDYAFDAVRKTPAIGKMAVSVKAGPGRKARVALLTLRRVEAAICPPATLGRPGFPISVSLVEAFEEHAPKGCSSLHWVLLTREPVKTPEDCVHVVTLYTYRWKIEEFHMAIKTGCAMEDRQLETRQRLEAFLGMASVIAIVLLRLRDAARSEAMASEHLSDIQILLLKSKFHDLTITPTAREALRSIARLGGFIGRKRDGDPGWRTLWRGMEELLHMEEGYDLVRNSPELLRRLQVYG